MAIMIIIRVVELHKHKVYQMAIKCRLSNCHVFLASYIFYSYSLWFKLKRKRHFPFIHLLDIAKLNFSFIILDSGFRIPDSGFRIPDSGFWFLVSGFRLLGLPYISSRRYEECELFISSILLKMFDACLYIFLIKQIGNQLSLKRSNTWDKREL